MAATRLMTVRIADDLREAAQEKAALEGRSLSEVVREYLEGWVTLPPKPPAKLKTWKD